MAKGKAGISKDDKNLSAIIADNNPQMTSGVDERASAARGYQKSND